MSSKIGITPAEIITSVKDLPPSPALAGGHDPLDAARAAMQARDPRAVYTRVLIYRFDSGGDTAKADAYQAQIQQGGTRFHDICARLDADVQMIELGEGNASPNDNARAAAFGMMAAEQDTGMLVLSAFGAGSDASGVDPGRFFETCTPETAALFGAMVAGGRAAIPVIAQGPQSLAAWRALSVLRPDLAAYTLTCDMDGADLALHLQAEFANKSAA